MTTYPLSDSAQIFLDIAGKFENAPITNQAEVGRFFNELNTQLGGLVILDFLDMANWDRIESYKLDPNSGILTLTWHDYRAAVESTERREMRQMFFPAALYSCALQVNSIVPIVGKSLAVFLINGYAKTEKEIKNLYKDSADEIKILDNSFFEKRVLRKQSGHVEVIDFHCTPLFSLAIVPKQSGIGSHHSKELLYSHNFQIAVSRIRNAVSSLDALAPSDTDGIAEKVNTVRRIMEFLLKVECCARELKLTKSYSQVLLGDLIAQVKPLHDESIKLLLGKFAELANEFSHDSGRPIDIIKAKLATVLALAYATLVELQQRRR
ncbi:MAG: hypothetical protein Q8Q84_12505 [Hydrogenophaga sp.]|nr:hypothetical protein [Hydrogenophaga sp.]MDP3924170.1 hypothetical protein [Hydrogenophaga sp.]